LGTVRVEIDRGHNKDGIDQQLPIAADRFPGADLRVRLALQPVRRFLHVEENVAGNEETRYGADHKKRAPPHRGKRHPVEQRSEQIAARIARLQKPGSRAPPFGRNRFHRQRGSDAPLAAHGDAEQRSNDNEGGEGRRQPGHKLKGREDQHVENQHATPADAIGHVTEQERTERTRS